LKPSSLHFSSSFLRKKSLTSFVLLSLPILAWFTLSNTNQYFFLRTVYFRASVSTIPFVEHFVNPENPLLGYLNFLLPVLEPSLDLLLLWTSYLPFQSQDFLDLHNFDSKPSARMGRKEPDSTKEADTSYPGPWRTKTTRADEPQLREKYSIPPSVKLRFDTKNEGAMVRKDKHEICVYEEMFEVGFRFPFPKVVRELLHYLQIAPHQLAPNARQTFFACVFLWPKGPRRGKRTLGARIFENIQAIKKS
jgi:hypothetical protein